VYSIPARGREAAPVCSPTRLAGAALALALAVACGPAEEPPAPEIRPVRTITVEDLPGGETVTLTGRIEAQEEVSLAFRVGQRLIDQGLHILV